MSQTTSDEFELYDLRVEVVETGKPFVMHARPGDTFDVIGGRIVFPPGREPSFSLYAMLAVLPFIPAKQRPTDLRGGQRPDRGRGRQGGGHVREVSRDPAKFAQQGRDLF